ncbi:MAG: hypothetical protein Q8S39_13705, partial [Ignavibacteria bacterium]|nr:hypothetical protein [Ignavibacteria bacterium]
PTFVKTISGITGMTRIWISGNYLFSYVGSEIRIYDLTNPETPVLKSNYATGSDLHKVAVKGNYMFLIYIMDMTLGKNGSLEIVDISSITNPQFKASLKPANSEGRSFCFSNTGNRIYVSHYNYSTSKGVIRELDYSNPALYSIIREITIEGAPVEMSIEGNRLFLLKDAGWAGPSKLEAYNIESSSITLLSSLTVSTGMAWDMHVYGNSVSVSLLESNGFKDYNWSGTSNIFDAAQSLNIPNSAQLSAYLLSNGSNGSSHVLNKVSTDNWFYLYYYVLEKSFSSHETETYGYFLRLVEKKIPLQQQPTKVQLTMAVAPTDASADGCSVTPPTGIHEYDKDADVTIDANAATGWMWDKWTGDASGSLKPQGIKMDRDKSIQGNFQPILQLSLSSPAERVICPPDEDEEITIASASIFVDGVNWQLNGLTFNFLEKVNFSFIEAWIEYNSTKLIGTIEADSENKIKTISFSPTVVINEGTTLIVRLYFKFSFPMISKTKRIFYPLSETKKYKVSISASQLDCLPIPASARPGVKLPIEVLLSGTQEIATFINTSHNPYIGFLKIMDAVNSSKTSENDIIEVCPCEHSEDVETSNAKHLTIKSRLGKEVTKISPLNSKKYVFSIGELTKVKGFTIDGKGLAAN